MKPVPRDSNDANRDATSAREDGGRAGRCRGERAKRQRARRTASRRMSR